MVAGQQEPQGQGAAFAVEAVSWYQDLAERSSRAGAYQAACLFLACVIEGVLVAHVLLAEQELRKRGVLKTREDPTSLPLRRLIELACEAGWIQAQPGSPSPVAPDPEAEEEFGRGAAEILASFEGELPQALVAISKLRNLLAHPGRVVRSFGGREDLEWAREFLTNDEIWRLHGGLIRDVLERGLLPSLVEVLRHD